MARPWHRVLAGAFLIAVAATSRPASVEATPDRKAKPTEIRLFGYDISASEHKTIILRDPDSPLQIESANTYYLSRNQRLQLKRRLHSNFWREIPEGPIVYIRAKLKNIAALKISILFYDSFDEWAGGFTGVSTDPPVTAELQWTGRTNLAWTEYGIACVFVSAVRMTDGRIWKANRNKIAAMMVTQGCGSNGAGAAMQHLKNLPKGALRL